MITSEESESISIIQLAEKYARGEIDFNQVTQKISSESLNKKLENIIKILTQAKEKIAEDKLRLAKSNAINKEVLIRKSVIAQTNPSSTILELEFISLIKRYAQMCPICNDKLDITYAGVAVYSLNNRKIRERYITVPMKTCPKCNQYFTSDDIFVTLPDGIERRQIKIIAPKTLSQEIPIKNHLYISTITSKPRKCIVCGSPTIYRGLFCKFHYSEEHYNSK